MDAGIDGSVVSVLNVKKAPKDSLYASSSQASDHLYRL